MGSKKAFPLTSYPNFQVLQVPGGRREVGTPFVSRCPTGGRGAARGGGGGGGELAGEIKPKSSHKHGAAESFQKICSLFGGLMNHAKLLNWSLWQKIKT